MILNTRFGAPPFSVLNTQLGYWQKRKNQWLALGIKSEVGREEGLAFSKNAQGSHVYEVKNVLEQQLGRKATWQEVEEAANKKGLKLLKGTSVFDPFLCELMYAWFMPEGDTILDPFAGGSVRGVVAAKMQKKYVGIELRQEQVDANYQNAKELNVSPKYHSGDANEMLDKLEDLQADFVFSCPPYYSLERYSKLENDLSNMSDANFISNYKSIISKSCARLKENRFACFVVSNVRNEKGAYKNLYQETISAFQDAGLHFYNEFVLVNQLGSLPVRVSRFFQKSRKNGRTHQYVLVFWKGDLEKAKFANVNYIDYLKTHKKNELI